MRSPLRYQYVVKNIKTEDIRKFGITHFEEHTGFPPSLVKQIIKGIEKIDYEKDEILTKLESGWRLEYEQIIDIPSEVKIPKDIQQHMDLDLPLLDRQIKRLKQLIADHEKLEQETLNEIYFKQLRLEKKLQRILLVSMRNKIVIR